MQLSSQQQADCESFRRFTEKAISPYADEWDRSEELPTEFIEEFAQQGYFGALVPDEYGGAEYDAVTFGLLNGAIAFGCASARSMLTVHSMVVHAVSRWGSQQQRRDWLPSFASGRRLGAFALTEPASGSDAANLRTTAEKISSGYLLSGRKKWVTFGQRADVFLVVAQCDGKPAAFLVDRAAPGLKITPIHGMLGTRASMLAELHLTECMVPTEALIGRLGFGITAVASSALDTGRYSVAWGCVGILAAALNIAREYAAERLQFGAPLRDYQLIQRMLADMSTNLSAARLLCHHAGVLKDQGDPRTVNATWAAKYFASCRAFDAASNAVQIFGASGCVDGHPAGRLLRDAKIMEIIEGSTQIQQIYLAQAAYHANIFS